MIRNRFLSGVAFGMLVAGAAAPAQSQEPDSVILQEIELEARDEPQPQPQPQAEPASEPAVEPQGGERPTVATKAKTVVTTRITRDELDAEQVSDFSDIGRFTPGVSYSETSKSFNIRGLDKNRVLTTIDGIRLPWVEDGARGLQGGIATFDLDMLSEVDLVKGSDSSIFGSGALGGVVAVRTLDPEDLIEPGKNWGGISRTGYDSRDKSWRVDQALAARFDDTYFMVQGGYRDGHEMDNKGDVGGYSDSRTKPDPMDYDQESLLAKFKQHFDGGHTIGITGEYFDRSEDIDDRSIDPDTYQPGTAFTDDITKRERVSANYSYDGGGFVDAADVVVYWQRQQLEDDFTAIRDSHPVGDYRRDNTLEEETYGVTGSLLKEFTTGSLHHAVTFGGELFASETSSYSAGHDNCGPPPYPPFTSCNFLHTNQADMPTTDGTTLGLFVQDEIGFFDGRFRLTPGVRYDWYEAVPQDTPGLEDNPNYEGSLPPSSSDSTFSGKLRAEYDFNEDVTLYAQWAQAFRAPTASELYLDYGGPGTYRRIGNPDLKPETSNGFEVGALFGDENLGGSVAAFYNRYKNFIDDSIPVPTPEYPFGVTEIINRDNVEIYGVEVGAHYKHVSGWHTWGRAGAYVGRDRDIDVGLNSIPPAKIILGTGYGAEHWGADLILTAAASRDFRLDPDTGEAAPGSDVENEASTTPAYTLLDFVVWWTPPQVKGLTFRAGVYNIFDQTYYEDGLDISDSAMPSGNNNKELFTEPGRNFRVTATYKF